MVNHHEYWIPTRVAAVHIEDRLSVTFYVHYFPDTLSLMSELTRRGSKKKGASQVSVPDVVSV